MTVIPLSSSTKETGLSRGFLVVVATPDDIAMSSLVDLAQHDAAGGNLVPLPLELERVLGRVFGEADAQGRERQLDQVGIQVQVQPGQHRDDRRPHVVVRPSCLFPVPFVEHLAEELAGTHLLCVGRRSSVEPVDVLGGPVVWIGPPCPITHRGVGVEIHEASFSSWLC